MPEKETKRKGVFELSTDARVLINVLERGLVDEKRLVTYEELSKAILRDVQTNARHLLQTARRHIQKKYKILTEVVMNEGVQTTKDYEGALDNVRTRARRMIKRRAKEVGCALTDKEISPAVAAKMSILGAIELMSRPHIPAKLIETIKEQHLRELSTAKTLKLFGA